MTFDLTCWQRWRSIIVFVYILVPGFADDDEAELSNGLSPDQGKASQSELIEDPELNEIAQKLKELEASSESEEEVCKEESISEEIIVIEGGTKEFFV